MRACTGRCVYDLKDRGNLAVSWGAQQGSWLAACQAVGGPQCKLGTVGKAGNMVTGTGNAMHHAVMAMHALAAGTIIAAVSFIIICIVRCAGIHMCMMAIGCGHLFVAMISTKRIRSG